jgi:GH25 family lysozyme M1 (1,4-beta-N-acetylmuramidase)
MLARVSAVFALALALLALGPATAPAERIPGIDVSRFQNVIDWARVTEAEVEFAFVQASRGSGDDCVVRPERCGADAFYELNYAGATEAGIRVGAYHRAFADGAGRRRAKADARAEARLFIAQVGELRAGDLLPALDVETPFGGLNRRQLRLWVRTWLERVEDGLGVKPIVYTNVTSWARTGDTTLFARRGHPLWVANWNVRVPRVPADNWAGVGWSIWQYTSSGSVPGIEGRVDRNWLRGGFEAVSVG